MFPECPDPAIAGRPSSTESQASGNDQSTQQKDTLDHLIDELDEVGRLRSKEIRLDTDRGFCETPSPIFSVRQFVGWALPARSMSWPSPPVTPTLAVVANAHGPRDLGGQTMKLVRSVSAGLILAALAAGWAGQAQGVAAPSFRR